jgi:hypothetical protein
VELGAQLEWGLGFAGLLVEVELGGRLALEWVARLAGLWVL